MGKVAHIAKAIKQNESKGEADTFRLWESYREQANLWRIIAVLQLFGSFLLICFIFYLYSTRTVTLHVPRQPLPGQYSINEIPEAALIEAATEVVNLIATYQPHIAEKQFRSALELLEEPALTIFKEKMLGVELNAIRSTSRSQVLWVDPSRNKIEPMPDGIRVSLTGERQKFIAGKQVPPTFTRYSITFVTRPRNRINQYGLVATKIEVENVPY
ncbi:MAG: hypothetical protein KDD70_02485 [Bdellovibrionales bacterium]|nr:hypothetical protein [Bdellovibrionales bacterium]